MPDTSRPTPEPGYYSRELKMPATKKDGLMNFIQMVINQLEAGNPNEALYIAVDLLNDVMCGNYDQAIIDTRNTTAALHKELEAKHLRQLAITRERGYLDGQRDARQEIAQKLGLV